MADHNEEFIADPTGHLIAILDEAREADQAERELSEAGFSEVHVYRGADGVETIDSSGSELRHWWARPAAPASLHEQGQPGRVRGGRPPRAHRDRGES
jgi:hypothetical protein